MYLGPSGLPVERPDGRQLISKDIFPASRAYQNSLIRSFPRSGTYAIHLGEEMRRERARLRGVCSLSSFSHPSNGSSTNAWE